MPPNNAQLISEVIQLEITPASTSVGKHAAEEVGQCHGVLFSVSQSSLPELLKLKAAGGRIRLSAAKAAIWQRYVLFHDNNDLQHGWSFVMQYEGERVIKTAIALDGDVLNQVAADLLPHRVLHDQLTELHYWLMGQLLGSLGFPPLKGQWLTPLAWGGAIAIVGIFILGTLPRLLAQPLLFFPALISLFLVQWGLAHLLKRSLPKLQRRLLRETLYGYFSQTYQRRRQGLRYLRKL